MWNRRTAPQFNNNRICQTFDRLTRRFRNFSFLQAIFNRLRAAFGCISPG
jgi:hypothetical protein